MYHSYCFLLRHDLQDPAHFSYGECLFIVFYLRFPPFCLCTFPFHSHFTLSSCSLTFYSTIIDNIIALEIMKNRKTTLLVYHPENPRDLEPDILVNKLALVIYRNVFAVYKIITIFNFPKL